MSSVHPGPEICWTQPLGLRSMGLRSIGLPGSSFPALNPEP